MEITLECVLKEAKCCFADMSSKYIKLAEFGNSDSELEFDIFRMGAYIRTLERNQKKYYTKKEVVTFYPEKVLLESLKKGKNVLYLNQKPEEKVVCTKVEITPCLTDSEIQDIIEEIRLLCSDCNCNCK